MHTYMRTHTHIYIYIYIYIHLLRYEGALARLANLKSSGEGRRRAPSLALGLGLWGFRSCRAASIETQSAASVIEDTEPEVLRQSTTPSAELRDCMFRL